MKLCLNKDGISKFEKSGTVFGSIISLKRIIVLQLFSFLGW